MDTVPPLPPPPLPPLPPPLPPQPRPGRRRRPPPRLRGSPGRRASCPVALRTTLAAWLQRKVDIDISHKLVFGVKKLHMSPHCIKLQPVFFEEKT